MQEKIQRLYKLPWRKCYHYPKCPVIDDMYLQAIAKAEWLINN